MHLSMSQKVLVDREAPVMISTFDGGIGACQSQEVAKCDIKAGATF